MTVLGIMVGSSVLAIRRAICPRSLCRNKLGCKHHYKQHSYLIAYKLAFIPTLLLVDK